MNEYIDIISKTNNLNAIVIRSKMTHKNIFIEKNGDIIFCVNDREDTELLTIRIEELREILSVYDEENKNYVPNMIEKYGKIITTKDFDNSPNEKDTGEGFSPFGNRV